jgi:ribonuclease BN (tRNA processing enzyme)
MVVRLWGTRGSLPTPGAKMVRYGGNTSCVEVTLSDGTHLVLDAGTGIRNLPADLGRSGAPIHVLLSHLHLDHIQGLLFFQPLFQPGLEVTLWGPEAPGVSLERRIARYLSAPLTPVEIRELPCRLDFRDCPTTRWLPNRGCGQLAVLPARPRAGDHRQHRRARLGMAVRVVARLRRRPADTRLPVHGRRVRGPRRLGPLLGHPCASARAPRRRRPDAALPP